MIANLSVPPEGQITITEQYRRWWQIERDHWEWTEGGGAEMRNESRKREDERWGALTWRGSRSGRIKDGGWESGIYWVGGMDGEKQRGGERPLGRIVLIEVSFPTRWDSTLITLCWSHHHRGAGLIRERGETVLGERERERERKRRIDEKRKRNYAERERERHSKCERDVLNKWVGEADLQWGKRKAKDIVSDCEREEIYMLPVIQCWSKTEKDRVHRIWNRSRKTEENVKK